jgi:hypothetical protein
MESKLNERELEKPTRKNNEEDFKTVIKTDDNDINNFSVGNLKIQIPKHDNKENEETDMILPSPISSTNSPTTSSSPISSESSELVTKSDESYQFKDKTFTVDVSEYLQKDLHVLNPEKEYSVHICFYSVVLDSFSPYLIYFLKKKENKKLQKILTEFPNYIFQLSTIRNPLSPRTVKKMTGGDKDIHKFEAEFMEDVYQNIYKYCAEPQQIPNIDPYYRGFTLKDDDIYIIIDATTLTLKTNECEFFKSTLYEILITRTCMEIPVHSTVTNLFEQMREQSGTLDFHHIKREDGTYLETPYCLYMCKTNAMGGYDNQHIIKPEKNGEQNARILFPHLYYDHLDTSILMTTHAFDAKQAITGELQRFVVFAEKEQTLYIEPDSENQLDNTVFQENIPEYSVVTFIDKSANRQFWSVSTPLIIDEL